MILNTLTAISPVDGRYRSKVEKLDDFFSEFALIRYRVRIETAYFTALCELHLPQLMAVPRKGLEQLEQTVRDFSLHDAARIKEIEKVTNHDVKAVEYFLKEKFDQLELAPWKEFIHFGLTSQDVNNTAVPLSIREALDQVYFPALKRLTSKLEELAAGWKDVTMLARTHGQPASPTKLGKEIMVFVERLEKQFAQLKDQTLYVKFGGATGNFNAHAAAYPSVDWEAFADRFVREKLGLPRSRHTTQIAHYDDHAAVFDNLRRINSIILDLDRDLWLYISMDYFKQKLQEGEVGSSTMPHKVNPVDFENSEGNIGIANAAFDHLAQKLPVSRLQRDLTDSTVTRYIGVPFAHTLIAIEATLRGLNKLLLNRQAIDDDLEANWAVVAEAIQTILRREDYPNPYEALKELTRHNRPVTRDTIRTFISALDIPETVREELLQITPRNYTGIF
ncbi:MAG: Adenylosuccinate lyase [Bacteroidetes bacterium ADurb.Bin123]|jgi:adenylosuccinate lyase|nr:MAG: Adenylosuccinate lyase [Bacteroidetes bacterium ADurb.Bin123]